MRYKSPLITPFIDLVEQQWPDRKFKSVFEMGSCDGGHTVELAQAFPEATILTLEAVPKLFDGVFTKIHEFENILFLPVAATDKNGCVTFHASTSTNPGNGSLLQPSGKYDEIELMPTQPITVPGFRLDTIIACLRLNAPEIMWLDTQGSELAILEGLGRHISELDALWTEVEYQPMYCDQPLRNDLVAWLKNAGMEPVFENVYMRDKDGNPWWGDMAFIRKNKTA